MWGSVPKDADGRQTTESGCAGSRHHWPVHSCSHFGEDTSRVRTRCLRRGGHHHRRSLFPAHDVGWIGRLLGAVPALRHTCGENQVGAFESRILYLADTPTRAGVLGNPISCPYLLCVCAVHMMRTMFHCCRSFPY